MITSRSNQQLKKVKKLLSSSRERRETGLFVAEGIRLCMETPAELVEALYVSEDCTADLSFFQKKAVERVEKSIFRNLSDTVTPQGIMAVVHQPRWNPGDILPETSGQAALSCDPFDAGDNPVKSTAHRILLLDGIRDPGNLGTMIRTAEAAGVAAVVMSPDCVDLYNPKVIRSTMGSIFRVPVVTADLVSAIHRLQAGGRRVYGTSLSAERSYREVDLSEAVIVIGSEANGISDAVSQAVTDHIRIPMAGQVESLNAAVSAAILMFC